MVNKVNVSVIIPVYNEKTGICRAVESVLNQSYEGKIEVIVVDDASTDGTYDLIKKYPVRIFRHDNNKGVSSARNTGAYQARGDIIAFTDADDIADCDWIRKLVDTYTAYNVDAVEGGVQLTFINLKTRISRLLAERTILFNKGTKIMLSGRGSNQSFKRSAFIKIGGYDENLSRWEDFEIILRLNNAGFSSKFNPDAIVYVYQTEESFLKNSMKIFKGSIMASSVHYKHLINWSQAKYNLTIFLHPVITIYYILIITMLFISFILIEAIYVSYILLILPLLYYIIKVLNNYKYSKINRFNLLLIP
ncbi:MAG: glycosyltransferase, partial [Candidatus Methanoperedens sp.]|nr:glycosyltransferase [Candidatus Methanoperedens sp.]